MSLMGDAYWRVEERLPMGGTVKGGECTTEKVQAPLPPQQLLFASVSGGKDT